MALKVEIKPTANWFTNERKQLIFEVKTEAGVPVDVSAWSMTWTLKAKATATEAKLTKTTANAAEIDVDQNDGGVSALVVVNIYAGDTAIGLLRGGVEYYHELKRTDPGSEGVLAFGPVTLNSSGIA
jgi:hypothetical protein